MRHVAPIEVGRDNACILYKRCEGEKSHLNLESDGKKERRQRRIEENDKIDKDTDKKRETGILKASCGRARVCMQESVCARACRSWLGHPTLFNVTLTSKPCVQALNADRMERVFI